MKKFWPALLMAFALILPPDADARRMGGGKSFGQQSGNVSKRNAAPDNAQGTPAQNAANPSAARPAAAAAPAAAPKKPWGAMLGGLAAGLGLAWLASSLGLGEGFAQFLMFALLALAAFALFKMFMRSRSSAARPAGGAPFAFQGAGAGAPAPDMAATPRNYSPDKVGNDASARPWERAGTAYDAAQPTAGGGSMIGSALAGSQNWGVPEGFDANGFIEAAKRNFHTLQAAWDRSDVTTLRSMMTDGMLEEIRSQLAERESHTGAEPNHTEVMMLEAQLLGI